MSNVNVVNLPKDLHDRAVELGWYEIKLEFSGGNDEGNLNVDYCGTLVEANKFAFAKNNDGCNKLVIDIEAWAEEAYDYSGAGDGSGYGDNIVYNLKTKKVSVTSWYMVEKFDKPEFFDLVLDETVEE